MDDARYSQLDSYIPANQKHLLQFWDQLSGEEKNLLHADLLSIDFERVNRIFTETTASTNDESNHELLDDLLQPLSNDVHESITRTSKEQLKKYREEGIE